jgi:hypothetical protein
VAWADREAPTLRANSETQGSQPRRHKAQQQGREVREAEDLAAARAEEDSAAGPEAEDFPDVEEAADALLYSGVGRSAGLRGLRR